MCARMIFTKMDLENAFHHAPAPDGYTGGYQRED